jgi:hypothetical protein
MLILVKRKRRGLFLWQVLFPFLYAMGV